MADVSRTTSDDLAIEHQPREEEIQLDGLLSLTRGVSDEHSSAPDDDVANKRELPGLAGGHHVLLEELGRGGIGVVYRALRVDIQRVVAIKLLYAGLEYEDRSRLRLLREATIQASIRHSNVCQLFECGTGRERPYISMEYLPGVTLAKWLDESRSTVEILNVFIQLGEAISAVHQAGFAHRSLSPLNVIVNEFGHATLIDFGLAQRIEEHATRASEEAHDSEPHRDIWHITQEGAVLGVPAYMSPEQLEGKPSYRRWDCYAFMIMLYEALAGTRPDAARNLAELIHGRTQEPNAARLPGWGRIPRRLRKTLLRGLQPDPALRHEGMDDILIELGRARASYVSIRGGSSALVSAAWFLTALGFGAITRSLGADWWVTAAACVAAYAIIGVLMACSELFRLGWTSPATESPATKARYDEAVDLGARSMVLGGIISLLLLL